MKWTSALLLGSILLSATFPLIENFLIDELEDYFDDGPVEYGPVDYWVPAGPPPLLLKSASCNRCPQRLRPPKPCVRCSADKGCESSKTCCPFITLSTTAKGCNSEQRNSCRLTNEIQVDFFRRACSCVRQIKCCVSTATPLAPQTTTARTDGSYVYRSTSRESAETATKSLLATSITTNQPGTVTTATNDEEPRPIITSAKPSITVTVSELPDVTTSSTMETSPNETTIEPLDS